MAREFSTTQMEDEIHHMSEVVFLGKLLFIQLGVRW
jgi:hypothetical protein